MVQFYDVLNSLNAKPNLDIYVTGSNSKLLSKDVTTNFRGRKTEIEMHPLSFAEFHAWKGGDLSQDWNEYMAFGGMPQTVLERDEREKAAVLNELFDNVYIKDVIERNGIADPAKLEAIIDVVSSSVGSLTNPNNVARALEAAGDGASVHTVASYLSHVKDAFLFSEARRYDVKGRTYFSYPDKYYCEDLGLRNARLSFRQPEITHLMENAVYNELVRRGHSVDVGVVTAVEKNAKGQSVRVPHEIDFVVNKGGERVYVQSAYAIRSDEKLDSERRAFSLAGDSFRKIIVRDDILHRTFDETGVLHVNLLDFLLDESIV